MANALGNGPTIPMEEGERVASELLQAFKESENTQYRELFEPLDPLDHVAHSVRMAIYALQIGIGLAYPDRELLRLVLCGLVNNVGMVFIPREVLSKPGTFSPEEVAKLRNHSEIGRRFILDRYGDSYGWLADITYQVHEREMGQGYPQSLSGSEIHEFAKILGLVDVYIALQRIGRRHRKTVHDFGWIKELLGLKDLFFPSSLIKVLLRQLWVFPLLSVVRLNSGVVGRVIETNREQPLRPTVKLIQDAGGKTIHRDKIIRLSRTPMLFVSQLLESSSVVGELEQGAGA